jgi:hypothetical protein
VFEQTINSSQDVNIDEFVTCKNGSTNEYHLSIDKIGNDELVVYETNIDCVLSVNTQVNVIKNDKKVKDLSLLNEGVFDDLELIYEFNDQFTKEFDLFYNKEMNTLKGSIYVKTLEELSEYQLEFRNDSNLLKVDFDTSFVNVYEAKELSVYSGRTVITDLFDLTIINIFNVDNYKLRSFENRHVTSDYIKDAVIFEVEISPKVDELHLPHMQMYVDDTDFHAFSSDNIRYYTIGYENDLKKDDIKEKTRGYLALYFDGEVNVDFDTRFKLSFFYEDMIVIMSDKEGMRLQK